MEKRQDENYCRLKTEVDIVAGIENQKRMRKRESIQVQRYVVNLGDPLTSLAVS